VENIENCVLPNILSTENEVVITIVIIIVVGHASGIIIICEVIYEEAPYGGTNSII